MVESKPSPLLENTFGSSVGETNHSPGSRLEQVLRSGRFAVTAELNPPDSADPQEVFDAALVLSSICDGINAVDASGANCVLCITGDDVTAGDQPQAKRVFDLDSIQLLHMARIMRDYGVYLSGRKLTVPPKMFLGAAENPFAPPFAWRPQRLAKKIAAGAEFIQTQYCFDMPRMRQFMQGVCDLGLDQKAYVLAGVGPLRSAGAAEFMRTKVPGVYIPDAVVERLKGVPKNKQRAEGKKICVEIIQEVRELPGVAGIHVMAYRQEELVAEIVEEAGLLPRPFRAEVPHAHRERHIPREHTPR